MLEISHSITNKKYIIDEKCSTILEIKKELLTKVNNGIISNFKIIDCDDFRVRECKNNEIVTKSKYMLVIVPIECLKDH